MTWAFFRRPAFVVALGVLVVGAIGLHQAIRAMGLYLTKLPIYPESGLVFTSLPSEYPSWRQVGVDEQMSKEAQEELGTDNSISRVYVEREPAPGAPPRSVQLHIAYYTGMIDTVPHVPERCMVGAGWQTVGKGTTIVDVPLSMDRLTKETGLDPAVHGTGELWRGRSSETAGRVRLPRGVEDLKMSVTPFAHGRGGTLYAGYFFIANGGVVASADQVRLLAFQLDQKYAYYCKVQFSSTAVNSAEELGELAGQMLDEMFPDIMRRVPDWADVQDGRYAPGREAGKGSGRGSG